MKVILARHGNTFGADEPAYYVGAQHDLPLVPFGEIQAQQIGLSLEKISPHLAGVYTGPLLRMTATARLALQAMHVSLQTTVDARLNELDYGLWSGLTPQAVRTRFGDEEYERWERQSQWPEEGHWGESAQAVTARIRDFSVDLLRKHAPDDCVLVVASNGCLRYFLTLVEGAFETQCSKRQLKIGTGHLCQLSYQNGAWAVDFWNQTPEGLLAESAR